MPTLTLLVEDSPQHGRRLLWDGILVLPGDHAAAVAAMVDGARFTADCRYTADGLVLREIKQALQTRGPTAAEQARRLVEEGHAAEALGALAALPAGTVEDDKHLLEIRMRALLALGRTADIGRDFGRLLQLPGLEPPEARRAFELLPPQTRSFFALRFATWACANLDAVRRWGADYVLEAVPIAHWPLELVLAELRRLLALPTWSAGLPDGTALQTLLAQANKLGPSDPRVVGLVPDVEAKLAALARPPAPPELKN